MSAKTVKNPVIICRHPGDWQVAEYDATKIKNVKWDCLSGGVGRRTGGFSLYGYIPYSDAVELVACSGRHDYGYNDAKICICDAHNKNPKYRKAYLSLRRQAGEKPTGIIGRPKGALPCTKRICKALEEKSVLTRSELGRLLEEEGYESKTISGAIRRLFEQGKISTEGPGTSPKRKFYLRKQKD